MAKLRKVITRPNRYLFLEEAEGIIENLNNSNYPNKLHKINSYCYMVELLNIDSDDRKKFLKEELLNLNYCIYKTDKTLKELRDINNAKVEEVTENGC